MAAMMVEEDADVCMTDVPFTQVIATMFNDTLVDTMTLPATKRVLVDKYITNNTDIEAREAFRECLFFAFLITCGQMRRNERTTTNWPVTGKYLSTNQLERAVNYFTKMARHERQIYKHTCTFMLERALARRHKSIQINL